MPSRRFLLAQRVQYPLRLAWFLCCGWGAIAAQVDAEPPLLAVAASLQQEPLTADGRQRTADELRALIANNPDTEDAISARYLQGRLQQLNGEAEEPVEFLELIALYPEHPFAQLARLKLIMRRLYAIDGPPAEMRLAAAETLGVEIKLPALACDFHLLMGDAYLFFDDQQAPALRHLAAAERLGIPSSATRATVLVQIGELARLTGNRELARRSYQRFLDEFPRDIRRQIVQDRLDASREAQP